jgi:hypothetical protein
MAVVAVVVAVIGIAALPSSSSASQGAVALFDDANGQALFPGGAPLAPTHAQINCVSVGIQAPAAGDRVFLSAAGVGGQLAGQLTVTVEEGTGGHIGDCSGFQPQGAPLWSGTLAALASTNVAASWQPDLSATRTFRFTVAVADDSSASGRSATGRFVWQLDEAPRPPAPSPSPSPSESPSPSPSASATPSPSPTTTVPTPEPTTTTTSPQPPPNNGPPSQPTTPTDAPTVPTAEPPVNGPPPAAPSNAPEGSPTPAPRPSGKPTSALAGPRDGGAGPGGSARAGHGHPDVVLGLPVPLREAARRVGEAARRVGEVAMAVAQQPQYPLSILILAGLFLLTQDLIDRRDPKLARARVTRRDDHLPFPDLFPSRGRAT